MIEVKKKKQEEFMVKVEEKGNSTEHTVALDDNYHQELTQGETTKEELIRKSFEFLLEREPKESILSKFNLRVIRQYFPEFDQKMRDKK